MMKRFFRRNALRERALACFVLLGLAPVLAGCMGGDGQGSENTNEYRTGRISEVTPVTPRPAIGRLHFLGTEGSGSFNSDRTTSPYAIGVPGTDTLVERPGLDY